MAIPRSSCDDALKERTVAAVPRSRYVLFFALAAGGCLADLLTKHWVFGWLGLPATDHDPRRPWWLWIDVVGFETSFNEGALFGIGQGKWALFAGLSALAAVGISLYLFAAKAAVDRWLTIALGLITGGILGNLYDRLALHGLKWHTAGPGHAAGDAAHVVRDWILVMIGSYHWPNFNVADSMLVIGACLLMLHALWSDPEPRLDSESRKA